MGMTKEEALRAVFDKALSGSKGSEIKNEPSRTQIDATLSVLAWLSEQEDTDGSTRDEIGHIRGLLWDL